VSIVSPKIQTTRRVIRGIAVIGEAQVIFLDTPGFCSPSSPLEKALLANFRKSYKDADLVLLVIDATVRSHRKSVRFIEHAETANAPVVVVINKIDAVKKESLLKIADIISQYKHIQNVFMISALTNDGTDSLKGFLEMSAIDGPWLYEDTQITDSTMSFRLAEITREKIFTKLKKELPYSTYVETELFHESEKKATVYQSIVIMKDSQKGIALGHGGSMIRSIKNDAIADMIALLNKKVTLKLFVKVREKWTEKKEHLHNAGII
ncbi:MAG: GTPase Era, partial [Holosporales bacterium]|nr:GTPase Era [Holosporales bacterium]